MHRSRSVIKTIYANAVSHTRKSRLVHFMTYIYTKHLIVVNVCLAVDGPRCHIYTTLHPTCENEGRGTFCWCVVYCASPKTALYQSGPPKNCYCSNASVNVAVGCTTTRARGWISTSNATAIWPMAGGGRGELSVRNVMLS